MPPPGFMASLAGHSVFILQECFAVQEVVALFYLFFCSLLVVDNAAANADHVFAMLASARGITKAKVEDGGLWGFRSGLLLLSMCASGFRQPLAGNSVFFFR